MSSILYPKVINENVRPRWHRYFPQNETLDVIRPLGHQCAQGNLSSINLFNVQLLNYSTLTQICRSFHCHFYSSMLVHRFSSEKPRGTVVLILFLTASIRAEPHGAFFKIKRNSFLADENTIWNGKAASLLSCSQKCVRQASCKSASFMTIEGRCSLHDEKQTKLSGTLLQREHSFYLQKVCCAVVFCFSKGSQIGEI